jgi:hypothetical protein
MHSVGGRRGVEDVIVAEDFTFAASSVMGDDVTGLGFPTCDAVDAFTFSRLGHWRPAPVLPCRARFVPWVAPECRGLGLDKRVGRGRGSSRKSGPAPGSPLLSNPLLSLSEIKSGRLMVQTPEVRVGHHAANGLNNT